MAAFSQPVNLTCMYGDLFAASQIGGNAGGHGNTIFTLPSNPVTAAELLALLQGQRTASPSVYQGKRTGSGNANSNSGQGGNGEAQAGRTSDVNASTNAKVNNAGQASGAGDA